MTPQALSFRWHVTYKQLWNIRNEVLHIIDENGGADLVLRSQQQSDLACVHTEEPANYNVQPELQLEPVSTEKKTKKKGSLNKTETITVNNKEYIITSQTDFIAALTEEFGNVCSEAWSKWIDYKNKEKNQRYKWFSTQLNAFTVALKEASLSEDQFSENVEFSMGKTYSGIYPSKNNHGTTRNSKERDLSVYEKQVFAGIAPNI
jgi:hypothetical protein